MADSKITALTAISTVDPTADPLVIVDVSDTSMAASGTTKKITSNQILGAGGTATLASATITGDLTVRTTGLTVNSSGVGIGTSSQSSFLGNSPKKLVIGDGTQTPALTLYGGSANVSGIYFADGTVGNEAYRGFIEYDHATDSFNIGKAGSSSLILNASGNLAFPTGKGIDFSATSSGSGTMTSELLNDYEEGTFVPELRFGSASTGITYSQRSGIYAKVGRFVHFSGRIDLSNKGSSTGGADIIGLPFAANTGAGSVGFQSSCAPSGAPVILTIDGSAMIVRYVNGTSTSQSNDTHFANNSILIFSGTYEV